MVVHSCIDEQDPKKSAAMGGGGGSVGLTRYKRGEKPQGAAYPFLDLALSWRRYDMAPR